ncbi:endonuclease/exonuclease/phosphatase family protein [Pedobacter psychrophilus]|nr:endonuclease/exonuclease/phosphatase family protein [Pedobacter psychrophilus]
MSYNIHHANPPSKAVGITDIDAVVSVIKKENPDIVTLQEVDMLVPRSNKQDQTQLIANQLNMEYHFYKTINLGGGEYGVAILSKYKLSNIRQLTLPKIEGKAETRTLGYADINFSGQKITVACTHLDARDEPTRVLQTEAIVKELQSVVNPIILCGDWNSSVGSKSIKFLQQYFENSCTDHCGLTVPAVNPKNTIDYVLTRNSNWLVKRHSVTAETYASDHRPVVVTFKLD